MFALQLFISAVIWGKKGKRNKIKTQGNDTLTIAWRQENKQLAYQQGVAAQIESENYPDSTRPCQTEGQSQIALVTTSFGHCKKQFLIQNTFFPRSKHV